MKVIGLTGGIASGKSTVSRFLAELGAVVIDADRVGHEAFKPGTKLFDAVVAAFGRQIVTPSGDIDRNKLGKMVFGSHELLARLNQIMHPRIYDEVKAQLESNRQQGVGVVVLEAALLLEAGWTSLVDEVWVTVASESTALRRLKKRMGLSEAEALARVRSQMTVEEKLKRADVVINNDGDLTELKTKVSKLWRKLQV